MNVRRRSGRLLITAGMTVVALLCAAPAAQAAFGFQGLSGAPTDLHAGAHSDIQIHVGFSDANQDVHPQLVAVREAHRRPREPS